LLEALGQQAALESKLVQRRKGRRCVAGARAGQVGEREVAHAGAGEVGDAGIAAEMGRLMRVRT
jgi:hypothetical protein